MAIITYILGGITIAVVLAAVITSIVKTAKSKKKPKQSATQAAAQQQVEDIKVKDGVRYTENTNTQNTNGEMNVTFNRKDVVVGVQTTKVAQKGGELLPGKYTILSASSDQPTFNVRIGKFVKEYKHGDVVVLAEGDEVTPTSHTIILR